MAHARRGKQITPISAWARGACGGSVVGTFDRCDADDNIITMCRNSYRTRIIVI